MADEKTMAVDLSAPCYCRWVEQCRALRWALDGTVLSGHRVLLRVSPRMSGSNIPTGSESVRLNHKRRELILKHLGRGLNINCGNAIYVAPHHFSEKSLQLIRSNPSATASRMSLQEYKQYAHSLPVEPEDSFVLDNGERVFFILPNVPLNDLERDLPRILKEGKKTVPAREILQAEQPCFFSPENDDQKKKPAKNKSCNSKNEKDDDTFSPSASPASVSDSQEQKCACQWERCDEYRMALEGSELAGVCVELLIPENFSEHPKDERERKDQKRRSLILDNLGLDHKQVHQKRLFVAPHHFSIRAIRHFHQSGRDPRTLSEPMESLLQYKNLCHKGKVDPNAAFLLDHNTNGNGKTVYFHIPNVPENFVTRQVQKWLEMKPKSTKALDANDNSNNKAKDGSRDEDEKVSPVPKDRKQPPEASQQQRAPKETLLKPSLPNNELVHDIDHINNNHGSATPRTRSGRKRHAAAAENHKQAPENHDRGAQAPPKGSGDRVARISRCRPEPSSPSRKSAAGGPARKRPRTQESNATNRAVPPSEQTKMAEKTLTWDNVLGAPCYCNWTECHDLRLALKGTDLGGPCFEIHVPKRFQPHPKDELERKQQKRRTLMLSCLGLNVQEKCRKHLFVAPHHFPAKALRLFRSDRKACSRPLELADYQQYTHHGIVDPAAGYEKIIGQAELVYFHIPNVPLHIVQKEAVRRLAKNVARRDQRTEKRRERELEEDEAHNIGVTAKSSATPHKANNNHVTPLVTKIQRCPRPQVQSEKQEKNVYDWCLEEEIKLHLDATWNAFYQLAEFASATNPNGIQNRNDSVSTMGADNNENPITQRLLVEGDSSEDEMDGNDNKTRESPVQVDNVEVELDSNTNNVRQSILQVDTIDVEKDSNRTLEKKEMSSENDLLLEKQNSQSFATETD